MSDKKKQTKAAKAEPLALVEDLAREAEVQSWELAALMRAARWAPGKRTTRSEFNEALARLRARPQGGGRI